MATGIRVFTPTPNSSPSPFQPLCSALSRLRVYPSRTLHVSIYLDHNLFLRIEGVTTNHRTLIKFWDHFIKQRGTRFRSNKGERASHFRMPRLRTPANRTHLEPCQTSRFHLLSASGDGHPLVCLRRSLGPEVVVRVRRRVLWWAR